MNAFWKKVLGTIGIAVVESYLEKHPALVPVVTSGEQIFAQLRQAIRDKNLIAAAENLELLNAKWGELIAELKK